jgi:hypothetical protein
VGNGNYPLPTQNTLISSFFMASTAASAVSAARATCFTCLFIAVGFHNYRGNNAANRQSH